MSQNKGFYFFRGMGGSNPNWSTKGSGNELLARKFSKKHCGDWQIMSRLK